MPALGPALALLLTLGLAGPATAEPMVATQDDAVHARAGRDYTRLATLRLGAQGRKLGNPAFVDGVLAWSQFGIQGPSRLAMRDVATGEVTRAERRGAKRPASQRAPTSSSRTPPRVATVPPSTSANCWPSPA